MWRFAIEVVDQAPRRVLSLMGLACMGLLGFALYLQHVGGLEPCPMCIVQRYLLTSVALVALVGSGFRGRAGLLGAGVALVVLALAGALVAARQSWLQWYPPEVMSCGRDLFGMVEAFPLKRVLPMVFKGGGDCSKVDWTFLGASIANWSFVCFVTLTVVAGVLLVRQWRK
jgi:disulfide bond formation protein DsbB